MTEDYSAQSLRAKMKSKAERLASGSDAVKVTSSDFTPAEPLNTEAKTGMRPLTRRRFKSGGKVQGAANAVRADKKPRSGKAPISADSLINRNDVEANEQREGKKHVGAFKKGGRAGKCDGGSMERTKKQVGGANESLYEGAKRRLRDWAGLDSPDYERKFGPETSYNISDADKKGMEDIIANRVSDSDRAALENMSAVDNRSRQEAQRKSGGRTKKNKGGSIEDSDDKKPIRHDVYDKKSGKVVGSFKNLSRATAFLNKKDNEHGGYRYTRKPIYDENETNMKTGGRAKKFMGGPMMQPGGVMSGTPASGPSGPIVDNRDQLVARNRFNFGTGAQGSPYKKGGKVEHDDVAEDKALIKKMVKPSARTGRKSGGQVFSGAGYPDKVPGATGGRTARATGGKTKGKTNINIVIAAGKPQDGMMPANGGMPPKMPSPAMPVQAPPAGMMPPMAGAGTPPSGPPAGAPPMPPMGRKAGGKVYRSYKDMDAGAGSGLGRLEKTEIASRQPRKSGGKAYNSYKDMDAGAGSGRGRLEKTEIASKTR